MTCLKIAEMVCHALIFRRQRSFVYDVLQEDCKRFLHCETYISAGKVPIEGRGYLFVTFIDDIFQHIHGKVEPKFAFKQSIGKNRPNDVDYLLMQEKLVAIEEGSSSWLRSARAASAVVVCAYDAPLHTSSHHVLILPYRPPCIGPSRGAHCSHYMHMPVLHNLTTNTPDQRCRPARMATPSTACSSRPPLPAARTR